MRAICRGLLMLSAIFLAACGGGGGPKLSLTFSPEMLQGTVYTGDTLAIPATATVSGEVSGAVVIIVVDSGGTISSDVTLQDNHDGTYSVKVNTQPGLVAGIRNGTLQIRLCGDYSCSKEYGSAILPYQITVLSSTNLTPLTQLAGAPEWVTLQGNAAHTGYVPVTLDPKAFSGRWRFSYPVTPTNVQPFRTSKGMAIAGGKVLVSGGLLAGECVLYAIDESTGQQSWTYNYSNCSNILGNPGVADQRAVIFEDKCPGSKISALSSATGAVQYSVPSSINGCGGDGAGWPVPSAQNFAVLGVTYHADSGEVAWQASDAASAAVTPAADDSAVYYFGAISDGDTQYGTGLAKLNRDTGEVQQLNFRATDDECPICATPPMVVDGQNVVVVEGESITDFDPSSGQTRWTIDGQFRSNGQQWPAAANGVIYVAAHNSTEVQARSLADGHLLWSWVATDQTDSLDGVFGNFIVTNNLLFLSTMREVYALDLQTHEPVWTYPKPGELALSTNGVLYVGRVYTFANPAADYSDGVLAAINLH